MHAVELMSKKERKEVFKDMKAELADFRGRGFTDENAGMAVAIMPDTDFGKCDMYRVAISYCNPRDKFKKKIGAIIAMERLLWNGEYIKIRRRTWEGDSMEDTMYSIAADMFVTFNS